MFKMTKKKESKVYRVYKLAKQAYPKKVESLETKGFSQLSIANIYASTFGVDSKFTYKDI